jgi:hypothetical protein
MPRRSAAPPLAATLLLLAAAASLAPRPARAGEGTLPPAYPPTYAHVVDPTYKGPVPVNSSKAIANEWTCRQTPGCASHYCGLPYVLSNSQGAET